MVEIFITKNVYIFPAFDIIIPSTNGADHEIAKTSE
jgi:hypothetical protein